MSQWVDHTWFYSYVSIYNASRVCVFVCLSVTPPKSGKKWQKGQKVAKSGKNGKRLQNVAKSGKK